MVKRAIVVHGYDLTDGGLGANALVCNKAIELWESGKYDYIILPAGVNEKTGEGSLLLWEMHRNYLLRYGIPKGAILVSDFIASDTATEVLIARELVFKAGIRFVDAVGFFPHSYKVAACWNIAGGPVHLAHMHHVFGFVGAMYWLKNVVSFGVGLYDPLGVCWPAREIKKRRRDLYTPAHLRDRVIF
jgi:hypothetical protein